MELTTGQIAHLARLAGLTLSAQDREELPGELGRILRAMRRLDRWPRSAAGLPVEEQPARGPQRADVPRRGLGRRAALGAAAQTEGDCFVVAPVLPRRVGRPAPEETG